MADSYCMKPEFSPAAQNIPAMIAGYHERLLFCVKAVHCTEQTSPEGRDTDSSLLSHSQT